MALEKTKFKNDIARIDILPEYAFKHIDSIKNRYAKKIGETIDLGMGNPNLQMPVDVQNILINTIKSSESNRYTKSSGLTSLKKAFVYYLKEKHRVNICHEKELVATLGSKEGLAHLAMSVVNIRDKIAVPQPCYPVHKYAFVFAGAKVLEVAAANSYQLLSNLKKLLKKNTIRFLVLNYPNNPSTECVDIKFFEEMVRLAKYYGFWIVHDFAYADMTYDKYVAPSIMQVKDAKNVAVETYSMSKSFNMAGCRIGFVYGNAKLVNAVKKIKTYYDYGGYFPIQKAAQYALYNYKKIIPEILNQYKARRDVLCNVLNETNWEINKPNATMFVWAKIPNKFSNLTSTEFTIHMLKKSNILVTPGIMFGKNSDKYVRISMILKHQEATEVKHRIKAAFENT